MATKKAAKRPKARKLNRAKKMKEVKPLINSFSFGASNPAD
ncbi:MAG TPA: hypothetical protein VJN21_11950 [Candidatus Acidoferrales bacterium]|nr:hypothetical protein [Candidatus Acidoferrales bacterium]